MEVNQNFGLSSIMKPKMQVEAAGLEDFGIPAQAIKGVSEAFRTTVHALQSAPWDLSIFVIAPGDSLGEEECWGGPPIECDGQKQSCVDDAKTGGSVPIFDHDKVEFVDDVGVPKLGDKGCVEGLPGDRGEERGKGVEEQEEGPILVLA